MASDREIFPPILRQSDSEVREHPNLGRRWVTGVGVIAVFLAMGSLVVAYDAWESREPKLLYLFSAIWVIVPPIWFWIEYFVIYRKFGDPEAFESYKFGQQISVAIWASLALFLVGFASSEHFKNKKPDCAIPLNNSRSS